MVKLPKYVKDVCSAIGVKGGGIWDEFTAYGLRSTVVKMLLEVGHSRETVFKKTGHRDARSLLSYVNIDGAIWMQMQNDMFGQAASCMNVMKSWPLMLIPIMKKILHCRRRSDFKKNFEGCILFWRVLALWIHPWPSLNHPIFSCSRVEDCPSLLSIIKTHFQRHFWQILPMPDHWRLMYSTAVVPITMVIVSQEKTPKIRLL